MERRLPVAIAVACLVTFGLFWAMQALVGVTGELKEGGTAPSIDFIRLRKDKPPELKKREPPKREKPEQPPPPPDMNMAKSNYNPGDALGAIAPMVDASDALAGGIGAGGGADRDVVPLVRIEPEYPIRARQRGLEGWVALRFTITRAGAVKDPVVVDAYPSSIFNRSALQAVQKWKYNPRIENGRAIERPGVKVVLDFSMEN